VTEHKFKIGQLLYFYPKGARRVDSAPGPYQRALIEQRMSPQADWSVVDALMLKTIAAAEKVARYRHAQLSAVRLAGDISGKMDDVSLDELLVTIKQEWAKLAPLIDLEAVEVPPG
jgi:hypothetical protein